MKKLIAFILVIGFMFPVLVSAQTVDSNQTVLTNLLQQLLNLYLQELQSLEQQLATLQTQQIVMQNEIASSTTSSTVYTPSPILTQIASTTPQVVQTTTVQNSQLAMGAPADIIVPSMPTPIISPITGDIITPSSQYWFEGSQNINQSGAPDYQTVYGVFGTSTPDITTSTEIFQGFFICDPIIGTFTQARPPINNETYYPDISTSTLSLFGQYSIQINSSSTMTIHNDNGTLELIYNPSLSSYIINTSSTSEQELKWANEYNESTSTFDISDFPVTVNPITYPLTLTDGTVPFGCEVE